jgi:hypothetical protein
VNTWINLNALWKIVVVGLLTGAGLPALFAVGLRALNPPNGPVAGPAAGPATGPTAGAAPGRDADTAAPAITAGPWGYAVAGFCFAVVAAAIAWGIYTIVNGS